MLACRGDRYSMNNSNISSCCSSSNSGSRSSTTRLSHAHGRFRLIQHHVKGQ